ncbi:MAG: putative ATPase [Thermodesulfobacterium sp.]|uniref:ATPase n=1 Tax=Candidatus Thermodesulfobacterium syntrophicum TaxID=3060442 RepID=A0AAE3P0N6_9BACT|nr:putative ATPase [Candidatus Thermodesulfobacterium syntrophicum]
MVDNFSEKQIVVTGSSSFDLTGEIEEPLTGRKIDFILFPFSLEEISQIYSPLEIKRLLPRFLVFGMYPEVVLKPELSLEILRSIAYSYAFKDIFKLYQIRKSRSFREASAGSFSPAWERGFL